MSAYEAYTQYKKVNWSRIEMLTRLYGAALEATRQHANSLAGNPAATTAGHRVKALALVGLIESGLDLSQGELPERIQELCQYVQQCLLSNEVDRAQSAVRVLQDLAEAFSGIRPEAVRLEEAGEIPPLCLPNFDALA